MMPSQISRAALVLVLAGALAAPAAGEEPPASAKQLFDAAEALQSRGEHQPALVLFERALALWVESGNLEWQAEAWYGMGVSCLRLGQTERAVELFSRALDLLRQLGDRAKEAAVLGTLGVAYEALGRLPSARESYVAAIALWRELDRALEQAPWLRSLGNVLLALGDVAAACAAFDDAFEREQLSGQAVGQGLSWNGVGRCRLARGEMPQALEAFEKALELSRQAKHVALQAGALNNISDIHRRQGNLSAALEHLFAANALRRQLGQKALVADGLQNLGTLYVALGQLGQALERYQEAFELYREVGRPGFAALARLSASWVRLSRGEVAPAVAELEQLAIEPSVVGDPRLGTDVARTLGFAHLIAGRPDAAERFFERALGGGREFDDLAGIARSLTGLGEAAAALGKSERARASFGEALALGGRLSNPATSAASLRGLARLARERGALEEALAFSEQALEGVERVRRLVPTPELRATFLAGQQEYYELHLDLLVRLHRRDPERGWDVAAFEASERARARGLLDLLSERGEDAGTPREPVFAERERALDGELAAARAGLAAAPPEQRAALERRLSKIEESRRQLELEIRRDASLYGALRFGATVSLAEAQKHLEPGTALLEYALGEQSSLGFVLTQESVHSFAIAATAEEIAARVASLRRALATPGRRGVGAYREAAWSLYRLLLGPVETRLGGVEQLLVVPDRSLHALPFEALLTAPPAGATGFEALPYLLTRWSVSYAPSASVLGLLERPRSASGSGLVVFADPADTGLARLPAAAAEARAIAALYPPEQSRLFFGVQANESNVKNDAAVRAARRLHFATHGRLDERWPQLSALELSRDPGSAEDGRLHVYEILRLDLAAELVVLSGCETALGQEVRGEGLIGLARAFLYAGASRAAVSLWRVDDAATAELMPRFYRHLEDQPTHAAALRVAKLELIGGGQFSHPSHWASFILLGQP